MYLANIKDNIIIFFKYLNFFILYNVFFKKLESIIIFNIIFIKK